MADLADATVSTDSTDMTSPDMAASVACCASCGVSLARLVYYTKDPAVDAVDAADATDAYEAAGGAPICFSCLRDPEVVAPVDRNTWAPHENPYLRLSLHVPGESTPRTIEVTDTAFVVLGRDLAKMERYCAKFSANLWKKEQRTCSWRQVVVSGDRRVARCQCILYYSSRMHTFVVCGVASPEDQATFCSRPICTKAPDGQGSVNGFFPLPAQESCYLMHVGTRIWLTTPDHNVDGPWLKVKEIFGGRGLEGYRNPFHPANNNEGERRNPGRPFNIAMAQSASHRFDFDLQVRFEAPGIRLAVVLRPDRCIVFCGVPANRPAGTPLMLKRGQPDPLGHTLGSGVPEDLFPDGECGAGIMKDKHMRAWTHVCRVPVDDEAFYGPLFLVRFLASPKASYVMVPLHAGLWKRREDDGKMAKVVTNMNHEVFAHLEILLVSPVSPSAPLDAPASLDVPDNAALEAATKLRILHFKRVPRKVFAPYVVRRSFDTFVLAWRPAESDAPIVRYEIREVVTDDSADDGERLKIVGQCEGMVCSFVLRGLAENTSYRFVLAAATMDGAKLSAAIAVTTTAKYLADTVTTELTRYSEAPHTDIGNADRRRQLVQVMQSLPDSIHLQRFLGATEQVQKGAGGRVLFQLDAERPGLLLQDIWQTHGAMEVVPRVAEHVTAALVFLEQASVVHRNVGPGSVAVRPFTENDLEEGDAVTLLLAGTFFLANFDMAVQAYDLRSDLAQSQDASPRRPWLDSGGNGIEDGAVSFGSTTQRTERIERIAFALMAEDERAWLRHVTPSVMTARSVQHGYYPAPEVLTLGQDHAMYFATTCTGDVWSLGALTMGLVFWAPGETEAPHFCELVMEAVLRLVVHECDAGHVAESFGICHRHGDKALARLFSLLQWVCAEKAPGEGDEILLDFLEVCGTTTTDDCLDERAVDLLNFVAECLRIDPKTRAGAPHLQVIGRPWFNRAGDKDICRIDRNFRRPRFVTPGTGGQRRCCIACAVNGN